MVKVLFDTSVLVAALWTNHPQHSLCLSRLKKVKSGNLQGIICTHTLAELYSVLICFPIKPTVSPKLAQQLIRENLAEFEVISLCIEVNIDIKSCLNPPQNSLRIYMQTLRSYSEVIPCRLT